MAVITAHLSVGELEARYKTAGDPIAKSHFHALWLVASGYEVAEVAELLSFSARWVSELVRRYNAGGYHELKWRTARKVLGLRNNFCSCLAQINLKSTP
jgi:Homeodomain-like domain